MRLIAALWFLSLSSTTKSPERNLLSRVRSKYRFLPKAGSDRTILTGSECPTRGASRERWPRRRSVRTVWSEYRCASCPDNSLGTTSSVSSSNWAVGRDSINQTTATMDKSSLLSWLGELAELSALICSVTRNSTYGLQNSAARDYVCQQCVTAVITL